METKIMGGRSGNTPVNDSDSERHLTKGSHITVGKSIDVESL